MCNIKKGPLYRYLTAVLCLLVAAGAQAQLSVTPSLTAATLAATLAGPGITISSPVLTCPIAANGTFTVTPGTILGTGATVFGINNGVLLTTGKAIKAGGAESYLASSNNSGPGDPTLVTLAGATTYDACILEFDLVPVGDTIRFNYQFGSEEYNNSTCGPYNDAFAFFISGPGIAGTANMALVPGTSIPVTVNSVNSGTPGPGYSLANCTAMGAGSPFTSYYVDNTGGTSLTYKGYTTKLTAQRAITPCNTYHMKMAVADAGNGVYDSGVFIEAGSLTTPSITGANAVCIGGTLSLSFTTPGGTWTSGNTAVATVDAAAGVITGVSAGTAVITYNLTSTCYLSTTVTVGPLAPITGPKTACSGSTLTLANSATGGTWSSSNTTVATVDATGIVTTSSAGTTIITYTTGTGCYATAGLTIIPGPAAITGNTDICVGDRSTLSTSTTGGTWSTGSTVVATVTTTTGMVSGISGGTTNITYNAGGCGTAVTFTVSATPPAITGPNILCVQNVVTLTNTMAGGTWSTSDPAIATVDATSGAVSGVTPGTLTVTYTSASGCVITMPLTVNVNPASISIATTDSVLCAGTYTTYLGLDSGKKLAGLGYTWQFGTSSITNMNPVAHAFEQPGQNTLVLTVNAPGCAPTSVSKSVYVVASPSINLGGDTSICPGSAVIILHDQDDYNYKNARAQWHWSTGQTTSQIEVAAPATYYCTVTVDGCAASDTVNVLNDCYMNIPNAFTPNGDGINDYFFPRELLSKGLTTFSMIIYNRWGNELFTTTSTDGRGWDGKMSGSPQPEGAYVYLIEATFKDGQHEHRTGNVTLLR
jgi:gliding motility-associated-like protein